MAYENRVPANYSFGTLSQAAQVADVTIASNDFATRLPTGLSSTTYVPITLHDPGQGIYEIVWCTGHTAGASTATVLRGRETTTSLLWPAGTLWTVAPTLRDGVLPVANRAALPTDPHVGLECLLQDEQVKIERHLASWGPPAAMLRQTTAQAVNSSVAYTPIQLQTEDYDNANGHDPITNNTRYTVRQAGRYQLAGGVTFAANATGIRAAGFLRNGSVVPTSAGLAPASAGGYQSNVVCRTVQLLCAVNDYIELYGYHDAGVVLNTYVLGSPEYQSHLTVLFIGG